MNTDPLKNILVKRKTLIEWALFEAKKYLSKVETMPKARHDQRKLIDELNIRLEEVQTILYQYRYHTEKGETK